VETRGGVIWNHGDTEAIAGVAAGYDFDLGDRLFAGVDVSADKILTSDTRVSWGFGGRAGIKTGSGGKLYALSDYQTKFCASCDESVAVGAGYQQDIGQKLYGKLEYRHYLVGNGTPDADGVLAGVGMKF
jgi:opacity protein-like surface antigen